jgi:hypothetical protein
MADKKPLKYRLRLRVIKDSYCDEFHDRFDLIHGIYGHALKTLTMGDES